MNKFGAIGCSHTSTSYGDSWPIHLSSIIDYDSIIASSPGAGNSMALEKTRALCEYDLKFIVVQITEPTRITTGLKSFDQTSHTSEYNDTFNDGGNFENIGYYTWNSFSNEPLFAKLGHQTKIDEFWRREIMTSRWCYTNTVHSMLSMQYICDSADIPLVFFSWFLPFEDFIPYQYSWIKEKFNLVDNCATNILSANKIKSLPDSHYGSQAHKFLVDNWLYRQIYEYVLK